MTAAEQIREALAALDAAMASADYPARHYLAPGASDSHLIDVMAPTGPIVPDEVLELWRWHDGRGKTELTGDGDTWELPGGFDLLSAAAAVRQWEWTREHFPWGQLGTVEPDWLPMAAVGNATAWVDCSGPADEPAPVRVVYPDDIDRSEVEARRVGSVARMIELWTIVLERGIWRLHRPGDIVELPDGRTYPLRIDQPMWNLDDHHPDLPDDWPQ